MNAFLRRLVQWRGKRKAAQLIVFDGAAEFEKTRSFARGAFAGVGFSVLVFALTAPTTMNPAVNEELERRQALVLESRDRAQQAMGVAAVCLSTAQSLEQTLAAYQSVLGGRPPALAAPEPVARQAE